MEINVKDYLKLFECKYFDGANVIELGEKKQITELNVPLPNTIIIKKDSPMYEYNFKQLIKTEEIEINNIYEIQLIGETLLVIVFKRANNPTSLYYDMYTIFNCYISKDIIDKAISCFIDCKTIYYVPDTDQIWKREKESLKKWLACNILFDLTNNKLVVKLNFNPPSDKGHFLIFFIECLIKNDKKNLKKKFTHVNKSGSKENIKYNELYKDYLLVYFRKVYTDAYFRAPLWYGDIMYSGVLNYIKNILGTNDNMIKEKYLKYKRKYLELRASIKN